MHNWFRPKLVFHLKKSIWYINSNTYPRNSIVSNPGANIIQIRTKIAVNYARTNGDGAICVQLPGSRITTRASCTKFGDNIRGGRLNGCGGIIKNQIAQRKCRTLWGSHRNELNQKCNNIAS